MPDTPDVDALVEEIRRVDRDGYGLDEDTLGTLADLARKAVAPHEGEYGYDDAMCDLWEKAPPEFLSEVSMEQKERVAAFIDQQQAALTTATTQLAEKDATIEALMREHEAAGNSALYDDGPTAWGKSRPRALDALKSAHDEVERILREAHSG